MPQLPDFTALGSSPSGNSGRRIVDYSLGIDLANVGRDRIGIVAQTGKGLEALGAGVAKVGEAGMGIAREQRYEQLKISTARADAAWMPERINRLKQYGEDDPDYDTAPKRFIESSPDAIRAIAEKYITDPSAREFWTLKAQEDAARDWATIDGKSRQRRTTYDNVTADESLAALQQTYVEAEKDPGSAHIGDEALASADNIIRERVAKGAWTEEQAVARRKQFAAGTFSASLASKDYETQLSVLGGFEKALVYRESKGNPTSQNKWGYSGLYQFGAPRLETLGVYKPGTNENMKTWSSESSTVANTPSKWTGTFDIPGFPGVKTIQDFLNSPDAQRKAFQMHIADIDKEISERGLDQFIGQTIQGVKITKEGIEAMAHLGGIVGAERTLKGEYVKPDANGTPIIQYAKLGLGGRNGDPMADVIDSAHREHLFNSFVDHRYRLERQEEAQTKEQIAATSGNYLTRALNNDFGTPTQSILDDIKNDPVLAKDPEVQYRLTQTIEREQASSAKGDAKTYGVGFIEARQEVIDGRLKDYSDVLKLSAAGKLTMQGVHEVNNMIQSVRKTPDANAIERVKQSMFNYAKKRLSFEDPSMPFLKDQEGEDIFMTQFVPMLEFGYRDWVEGGKNPREFLDKANIDKMLKGLRDPDEMAKKRLSAVDAAMGQSVTSNPAADLPLPPPAGANKDAWQKAILERPTLADGKPEAVFKWTNALSRLVANRNNPLVRKAFSNRYPKLSADDILMKLGF